MKKQSRTQFWECFVVTISIFQNRFELKVVFHFFPLGNASAFS